MIDFNKEDVGEAASSVKKKMNSKSRFRFKSKTTLNSASSRLRGPEDKDYDSTGSGSADISQSGVLASEQERYLFELRSLIEKRKVYPPLSKQFRETGRVLVRFQITREGLIKNVTLKVGSAHRRLDEAALNLISDIERYKPLFENFVGESLILEIPIDYLLR